MTALDECDERLEEFFASLDESRKRWSERLSFDTSQLAERYIHGELRVAVIGRSTLTGQEQLCAWFYPDGLPAEEGELRRSGLQELVVRLESSHDRSGVNGDAAEATGDGEQQVVLINDVQLVDGPKPFLCPSRVRLQRLDSLLHGGRGALELVLDKPVPLSFARRSVMTENGKRYIRFITWGDGEREVIERCPQIMDAVANDQRNDLWERFADASDEVQAAAGIRLSIGAQFVGISVPVGLDVALEISRVVLSPVDLRPDTAEIHGSPSVDTSRVGESVPPSGGSTGQEGQS